MKGIKTMKKRKTMKKIIALLLTVIIVICSLPMTAFANTLESTFLESENEAVNEGNENWHLIDEQEIVTDEIIGSVSEVESLREENVKHFRLPDGTYEAVVYSQPVHRKDKEGVWRDIDNTIELKTYAKASKYATRDSRVTFADRFTNNADLFTLSENGYSISMQLLSNGNEFDNEMETTDFGSLSTPIVNNRSEKRTSTIFNSIDEAKKIDNKSSIVYNNIRKNINIEYVLNGNDVKENIIVNAPCESYEYIFQITLDGLFAELSNNGEILVKDNTTKDTEYIIPAPYMYDANGTYSYDVSYTLEQVKDEIYLLVVSADSKWINSEDRAFPVVIDPTFEHYTVYYDSYIDANNPTDTFGYDPIMWVSNDCAAFIQMDLPQLPDGATVNSAYLHIPYYYHITTGALSAALYDVTEQWYESSICFDNFPNVGNIVSTGMLVASTNITENNPGMARFTITSLVNQWYGGTPNYGVMLTRRKSSVATNQSVILKSYEAYDEPTYISIDYTYYLPDGVYALQNDSYYNQWMSIEDDSCWSGNNLQQEYSSISPLDTTELDRSRLFKITRIPGTPRYTIRSMLNNTITFEFVGNEIITKEISAFDDAVPNSNTFSIEWQGDRFLISPYGSSYVIGTTSETDANLAPVLKANATAASHWCLEQYTGTHEYGYELFSTKDPFIVGENATFITAVWSTKIGYNYPVLFVPTEYSSKISFEWNTSNRSAAVKFLSPGQITIGCSIYDQNMEDYYGISARYNILPIREGTYYIQNAQTQKYVTEQGFSSSVGGTISQDEYNDGILQQWAISYVSGLYVTIKSVTNNMYLGVDPNDSTNIVQCSQVNNYSQWKLEITEKGNFKFTCKAFENNDSVLATTNNIALTMSIYVNNGYEDACDYDEWYLVKKIISIENYYDSTFVNIPLLSYINEVESFANLVYARYYNVGIHIEYGETLLSNQTLGMASNDVCPPNSACTDSCAIECANHHKNIFRIAYRMEEIISRQSNHIHVLWTNHKTRSYCSEKNNEHTEKTATAVVCPDANNNPLPIIHFLSIIDMEEYNETTVDKVKAIMSLVLVHEIAHVINMEEVYITQGNHRDTGDLQCIMRWLDTSRPQDYLVGIMENDAPPFCEYCKSLMKEHTSNLAFQ